MFWRLKCLAMAAHLCLESWDLQPLQAVLFVYKLLHSWALLCSLWSKKHKRSNTWLVFSKISAVSTVGTSLQGWGDVSSSICSPWEREIWFELQLISWHFGMAWLYVCMINTHHNFWSAAVSSAALWLYLLVLYVQQWKWHLNFYFLIVNALLVP